MISRRWLLKLQVTLGFLLATRMDSAMANIFFRPRRKAKPRMADDLFTEGENALVGVANGQNPEEMIREAVSSIGGFEKLRVRGKTVLVKPNVVAGELHPTTTNPKVVEAVVRILYDEGARKVYVGDMSAMLTLSTSRNMTRSGIRKAAEDSGAEVVMFEEHEWIEVPLPEAKYIKKAYVTEWLYKVDLIVNLPVIKTHRSATYTICLKNFIGCTHLKQRPYLIDSEHWEELIAEFNLAYRPEINIVDGTVSMIAGGPWEGTPAKTNLIIASGDRVAADVLGLGIIKSFDRWGMVTGKGVWEQRQIKRALELGIGKRRENIRLIVGKGSKEFQELMESVKREAGL